MGHRSDIISVSLTTTDSTKAAKILNAMGLNAWDVAASLGISMSMEIIAIARFCST